MDSSISKKIETEHYTFNVLIKNNYARDIYYSQYLQVGDSEKPCLSLTINTSESAELFGSEFTKTAKLSNIEVLYDCVMEEDAKELFDKYSFGRELLLWVISYIKTEFPHVKYLQLDDESYIPCNRDTKDFLDLISYSVAVNSKTWYEMVFGAIIRNKEKYDEYKLQIENYSSPETKKSIQWDIFFLKNITTPFAMKIVKENEEIIKVMYEKSNTFPEFFSKLSKYIGKETKCRFFKNWLEEFIRGYVGLERRWTIILQMNGGRSRKSRRNLKKAKNRF